MAILLPKATSWLWPNGWATFTWSEKSPLVITEEEIDIIVSIIDPAVDAAYREACR